MQTIVIAKRVITQLKGDKRFLILSIVAPVIIVYFLKLMFNALTKLTVVPMPEMFPMPLPQLSTEKFVMPVTAFIVHFLSFILCSILLVQERTRGTLERMLISGYKKSSIILGYVVGYFGLATIQSVVILTEAIYLFDLNFDGKTLVILFMVIWMLAIVSVMLGIFISTFARNEGHIFPFIPLIILPSLFLTGVIVDANELPKVAEIIGYLLPLRYANNIIQIIGKPDYVLSEVILNFGILLGYATALWFLASKTMKETE